MLSVHYGPFQPSLEDAFLKEVADLHKDAAIPRIAVITPSRRLADRLQRLIALEGGHACLGVTFHTFYSFALEVVSEAAPDGRAVVREPMFFDRLLDSLLDKPAQGVRPRGLAASYRASLKDLIDAGVGSGAAALLEEGLIRDEEEKRRLKGLLDKLAAYEKRMRELDVMPPSGLTERAVREVRRGSAALGRYSRLLYYGFYDLTGLQAEFFEAVAKEHPVTLFFPYRRGHPAFAFADRFFETRLHIGGRAPQRLPESTAGRALGPALDALFAPGRSASVPPEALRFFSASGARDEAWRTGKEILRLVEGEGRSYDDIGVVARTLEPYRAAIEEAFSESHIPLCLRAEEPLLRRPAARLCMTLLTLARRDYPALAVLDLVGSPFYRRRPGPHWRVLIERLRIHRGWLQWEGKLAPIAHADFQLYPHLQEAGRGTLVPRQEMAELWGLLCAWRERLAPAGTRKWSTWAAYARELLTDYFTTDEDRGFQDFSEALGRFAAFDLLGEKVTFADFLETVEDRLSRLTRPEDGAPTGGVRVMSAMDARGESFGVLFVLGLKEGLFPRTVREDPLLRDASRVALNRDGGYWIGSKQAGYDEEKLLFYLLAASARDRLYCSYPRSDEDGRAQIPSIYLLDLCRAAGLSWPDAGRVEHVPRPPQQKLSLPHLAPYLSPKEASVAAALAGMDARPLHRALGFDASGFRALAVRVEVLNRYGKAGAMDGVIGPPDEFLKELRRAGLSPSSLETLARCPFQYYATKVLGLNEPEEPSASGVVSPAVKGEIYHALLRGFYSRLTKSGYWSSGDSAFPEAELREEEQSVLVRYSWRELGVYPLLWIITLRGIRTNLRRFLLWDIARLREEGLTPRWLEKELRAEILPHLPKALAGMPFQGRADRIDTDGSRFRVIDYKTRWRRDRLERLALKGELFQPTIYRELAARYFALEDMQPDGVVYLALEDAPEVNGKRVDHIFTEEEYAKGSKALLENLAESVERIAAGRFTIRPDDGAHGHCRWCSFGDMCRKNHGMTLARSQVEG
ncbi:MAG: PD-(D/E)XK nuclease family protein [Elusimicrobiota bacterium]